MRFSKMLQDRSVLLSIAIAMQGLIAMAALPDTAWSQGETTATPPRGEANTIANGLVEACYIPASGTVYLLKEPGLKAGCVSPRHVYFSWTTTGETGPTGPIGPTGATGATGTTGPTGSVTVGGGTAITHLNWGVVLVDLPEVCAGCAVPANQVPFIGCTTNVLGQALVVTPAEFPGFKLLMKYAKCSSATPDQGVVSVENVGTTTIGAHSFPVSYIVIR